MSISPVTTMCEPALMSRSGIDIDDQRALEAVQQYLKQIIVQLKPSEEQMRWGKHSCVMASWNKEILPVHTYTHTHKYSRRQRHIENRPQMKSNGLLELLTRPNLKWQVHSI